MEHSNIGAGQASRHPAAIDGSAEKQFPDRTKRNVPRLEALTRLGIGNTKFHELSRSGVIPLFKIGSRSFIRSADLDRLLDNPDLLNARPENKSV